MATPNDIIEHVLALSAEAASRDSGLLVEGVEPGRFYAFKTVLHQHDTIVVQYVHGRTMISATFDAKALRSVRLDSNGFSGRDVDGEPLRVFIKDH